MCYLSFLIIVLKWPVLWNKTTLLITLYFIQCCKTIIVRFETQIYMPNLSQSTIQHQICETVWFVSFHILHWYFSEPNHLPTDQTVYFGIMIFKSFMWKGNLLTSSSAQLSIWHWFILRGLICGRICALQLDFKQWLNNMQTFKNSSHDAASILSR